MATLAMSDMNCFSPILRGNARLRRKSFPVAPNSGDALAPFHSPNALINMCAMKVLVTGSSGLIGSEAVIYFDREGHAVVGLDNNLRREFFGPPGDTLWNLERVKRATKNFRHLALDIRDRQKILDLFKEEHFDLIIHCAAQPSHDKAAEIPFMDFDVNAVATLN